MEVNADYDAYEPWLAVELNGVQISRVPLNKGKNEVCLFRGMTVGKPKHVRILKEVQAMHQDPLHMIQIFIFPDQTPLNPANKLNNFIQ